MIDLFLSRRDRLFQEGTSRSYLDQRVVFLKKENTFSSLVSYCSSNGSGTPSILLILRSFVAFLDLLDRILNLRQKSI